VDARQPTDAASVDATRTDGNGSAAGSDGGCGCDVAGARAPGGGLAALLLVLVMRRRRPSRRSGTSA
jgi:MYXO-CTERM domain-containing protein